MVKELENSDRNITCDKFCTSLSLPHQPRAKKFTIAGTMRKNKTELPPEFTNPKDRVSHSTLFGFQTESMILSHCPKTFLLSTSSVECI